jgi:methionyl aminopeptidase
MAIRIKSAAEIEKMRVACHIVRDCLNMLEGLCRDGITTNELNNEADKFIRKRKAIPSFLGYRDFPKSACISVNNEIIHGIPGMRRLKKGDIVSIDIGAYIDGFHGDCARTFGVDEILPEARRLIDETRKAFFRGIEFARAGNHLNQIGAAIERHCMAKGYSVVREYAGHGVGAELHEEPSISNFYEKKRGTRLSAGMTLAIEPMVCAGKAAIVMLKDEQTVATADGSLAAHYEDTVLITPEGPCEILTI